MIKICFVIMGYGNKTDYLTGRTFNLNKTYENIIKPSVESCGYECIRGDEIDESGVIDKSMFALLIQADLVIADITTFNPNAIYELGIRHATKPYSTIVMKEVDESIPFDLNKVKIFHYEHLGKDIGASEADRCKKDLIKLIRNIETAETVDSPMFEYIKSAKPQNLLSDEYEDLLSKLSSIINSVERNVPLSKIINSAKERRLLKEDYDQLIDELGEIKVLDNSRSPLSEIIQKDDPKELKRAELDEIVEKLSQQEKQTHGLVEQAMKAMTDDEFIHAKELWEKIRVKSPKEPYFIQQHAIATYRSEHPSKEIALIDALTIISLLEPGGKSTNDPETLGISGAIFKRLYLLKNEPSYLDKALEYYGKGFKVVNDYYTGENYALCLDLKSAIVKDPNEKVYYSFEAKMTREKIIQIIQDIFKTDNYKQRVDIKWIYASMATCSLALGDTDTFKKYEQAFYDSSTNNWERTTFLESIDRMKEIRLI